MAKIYSRILLVFLISAVLPVGLAAQKTKRPRIKPITASVTVSASKPTLAQRRLEAFETAWFTLDQRYFDKTFGGLDWKKVRDEFRPRVIAAKTDLQFHQILEEMINRLGKSHLSIITPEYFENLEKAKVQARTRGKQMAGDDDDSANDEAEDDEEYVDPAGFRYGIGVDLRMLGDQIVITRVEEGSGAANAGIKAGFVIDKINGVSLADVIELATSEGTKPADIRDLLPMQLVDSFLNGEPDSSVFLTCLDDTDQPREFTVPRVKLTGEAISIGNNFPEQFLRYEARSLNEDVGYIRFNTFAVPVIGKFCESLTEFAGKSAIIVDLRGNLGGIIGSMIGLSGMLTEKPITLGNFVSRSGSEPFTAAAKQKNFKGRVVLLVDGQSMSASEIFAAGLRGNDRAIVVGDRTGGKSLPAVWVKLATGAVMMYPVADFITTRGGSLEGVGLAPDHAAALDRSSLLRGVDTQLAKALAVTADEAAFAKLKPTATVRHGQGSGTGGPPQAQPPPPPPPARAQPPSGLAAAAPAPKAAASDQRSLKIIADFTNAVGGTQAVERIQSYEARGNLRSGDDDGIGSEIYTARQAPDKFLMVINSPSLGEVREIYNGNTSYLQADYGLERSLYPGTDTTGVHLFAPLFHALDPEYVRGLKYEGDYEVEGRKRQVLSATAPTGQPIGLSFDASTKLLVTFSAPGLLYTFSDYRKTDGVALPYRIELEGLMYMTLTSVSINPKLDPATFEKIEKCFDKAN